MDSKLAIHMEWARLSSFIREQIDKRVLPNVASQARLTTAYRLPAFDADGNRSGNTFSISPEPMASAISIDLPYFRFQLGDWFDNAVDWFDEKAGWLVGGKEASDQRRAQRLQERWEHIAEVFSSEWRRHVGTSLEQVKQETIRQYQTLYDPIDDVFGRIEHHVGGSVSSALDRIQVALEKMAVPPVFQSQMLTSLSIMQSGRIKDYGKRAMSTVTCSTERAHSLSPQRSKSNVALPSTGANQRQPSNGAPPYGRASKKQVGSVIEVGDLVIHKKLGRGEIVSMKDKYCLVQFDSEDSPRKFKETSILDPGWFSRAD